MDSVCFEVPESLAFEGFRVSRSRCRVSRFMVARSRVFGVGFRVKASGLRGKGSDSGSGNRALQSEL